VNSSLESILNWILTGRLVSKNGFLGLGIDS
jgi:hypothetical protein